MPEFDTGAKTRWRSDLDDLLPLIEQSISILIKMPPDISVIYIIPLCQSDLFSASAVKTSSTWSELLLKLPPRGLKMVGKKTIKLFSVTGRFSTSGWRPWEWCFRWGHHSYYLCISKSRHQGEPEITDSRSSPGVDGGRVMVSKVNPHVIVRIYPITEWHHSLTRFLLNGFLSREGSGFESDINFHFFFQTTWKSY